MQRLRIMIVGVILGAIVIFNWKRGADENVLSDMGIIFGVYGGIEPPAFAGKRLNILVFYEAIFLCIFQLMQLY